MFQAISKEVDIFSGLHSGYMLEAHQTLDLLMARLLLQSTIGMNISLSGIRIKVILKQCILTCNFRSHEIKLQAGQSYQLNIVPTQHTATNAFRQLSQADRGCRLSTEVYNDSIFDDYSEKGCIFECVLRYAVSSPRSKLKTDIRNFIIGKAVRSIIDKRGFGRRED